MLKSLPTAPGKVFHHLDKSHHGADDPNRRRIAPGRLPDPGLRLRVVLGYRNIDFHHLALGLQSVVTRQIRLQGSCASSGEYPACISMMSRGAIRVEPLLSAVAPLEDGVSWFQRLYAHEPGLLKVVLEP